MGRYCARLMTLNNYSNTYIAFSLSYTMNWIRLFLKLGLIPLKLDNKVVHTDYKNLKFLIFSILKQAMVGYKLWALILYYQFDSLGPLQLVRIVFYMMVNDGAVIFQIAIAWSATKIGAIAVDVDYKVVNPIPISGEGMGAELNNTKCLFLIF